MIIALKGQDKSQYFCFALTGRENLLGDVFPGRRGPNSEMGSLALGCNVSALQAEEAFCHPKQYDECQFDNYALPGYQTLSSEKPSQSPE